MCQQPEQCTTVTHIQPNQRYTVSYERSAVKGTDGFKVTANGDELPSVQAEATRLYLGAIATTSPTYTIPKQENI